MIYRYLIEIDSYFVKRLNYISTEVILRNPLIITDLKLDQTHFNTVVITDVKSSVIAAKKLSRLQNCVR